MGLFSYEAYLSFIIIQTLTYPIVISQHSCYTSPQRSDLYAKR